MGFESGSIVRASFTASYAATGTEHVNTLHYDFDYGDLADPGDSTVMHQALADTLRDDVRPAFAALYDSGWTIGPVVVYDEKDPQNPTRPRREVSAGPAISGTHAGLSAGTQLPLASCAVATFKTANIGRRATGRTFLSGTLGEDIQSAGVWGATQLTLWQAYLDAIPHEPDLVTGPSTAKGDWCVYSRTSRAQNVDPYAAHVTSTVLRTAVHWLRSRET